MFEAIDETSFTIRLKRPFPVELALANNGSGLPSIMREKEASAGSFTKGTEIIGAGPFRFVASEWRLESVRDGIVGQRALLAAEQPADRHHVRREKLRRLDL